MPKYIPCQTFFMDSWTMKENPDIFKPTLRFPIKKIIIDKSKLSFPNPVIKENVDNIVNEFYLDAWEPVWITPDYYLVDGQHRIEVAKRIKLEYMDVIIYNEKENKNKSKTKGWDFI